MEQYVYSFFDIFLLDLKHAINIHVNDYSYTEEELDHQYGKGRYAVIGHNCKTTFNTEVPRHLRLWLQ